MKWREFLVTTNYANLEIVTAILLESFPQGFQIEEAENNVIIKIYTSPSYPLSCLKNLLRKRTSCLKNGSIFFEVKENFIEENDFVKEQTFFKPIKIGEKLLVKLSSKGYFGGKRIVIEMKPGIAFGTGTHPTTQGCLLALESLVKKGDRVLDVGTGSGILAIAAAKLGASKVWAIDSDELSVKVAGENIYLNQVAQKIFLKNISFEKFICPQVDILIANLTKEDIFRMLSRFKKIGKSFIFSGILTSSKKEFEEKLSREFNIIRLISREGWLTVVCRRKDELT